MIGLGLFRHLGLLVLLPAAAIASPEGTGDAIAWLHKMARAAQEQNYDGDFVYDDGTHMEALRIIHRGGSEERERIVSLTGSGREVMREGGTVTCVFPETRQIYVDADAPGYAFRFPQGEALTRLQRYYRLRLGGQERVAGRTARVLEISPLDEFRYGYRLWLDEETALLLKSELLDPKGQVVERLMFTRLTLLDRVPDELLRPQRDLEDFQRLDNTGRAQAAQGDPAWLVSWLPGGFQLTERRSKQASGNELVQLVFGDGFSLVSVFIEPADGEDDQGVLVDKGAVHGYSVLANGHRITVIGELPAEAVAKIARSVHPQELAHAAPAARASHPAAALNP